MLRLVSAVLLVSLGGCSDAGRPPIGTGSAGSSAVGGGEAVEARQAQPMVVDVPDGAAPDAVPGCTPWPEGVARTQKQFEVVPVTEPDQTFVLDSPAKVIRFYDDQTDLSLRIVHQVYERADGAFTDAGVPYLRVGDGCLELLERIELQNGGYHFTIIAEGCRTERRSGDDYVYSALANCSVRVQTTRAAQPAQSQAAAHHSLFALNDRFTTYLAKSADGELIALRSTGTEMGNVDISVTPPYVSAAKAGLDVVTSFGVANLEIDYFDTAVVGSKREVTLGPQDFTLTIDDIGNTNTHCYTGSCKNVFDLDVLAEKNGDQTPLRILSYE